MIHIRGTVSFIKLARMRMSNVPIANPASHCQCCNAFLQASDDDLDANTPIYRPYTTDSYSSLRVSSSQDSTGAQAAQLEAGKPEAPTASSAAKQQSIEQPGKKQSVQQADMQAHTASSAAKQVSVHQNAQQAGEKQSAKQLNGSAKQAQPGAAANDALAASLLQ
jgi:hypothetical protein